MIIRQIDTPEEMPDIWHVGYDANGNSRYVVHYLAIPTPYDEQETNGIEEFRARQTQQFEHARDALAGKRYRAKWYGGGIVFQAYAGDPIEHVRAAMLGKNQAEHYAERIAK